MVIRMVITKMIRKMIKWSHDDDYQNDQMMMITRMNEATFCRCALQLLTGLDSLLSCILLYFHYHPDYQILSKSHLVVKNEGELPEDPFKLDGASATADVGFHHQIVLLARSQDHPSSVCPGSGSKRLSSWWSLVKVIYMSFIIIYVCLINIISLCP